MAALRDIARDFAAEIRDGIGWTIVYRTGRSWNALTIWSDIWNGEWETNDLNDAIGILKADPDAGSGNNGLRPACYLDSDLLISVEDDEATDDVTPEHAGEIIAALAEQFGGTFATEDQLTTALSFMLGTLRATREKEARHE